MHYNTYEHVNNHNDSAEKLQSQVSTKNHSEIGEHIQSSSIAGLQYAQAFSVWSKLRVDQSIVLRQEPENPHDFRAIAVYWGVFKLGYIPRDENTELSYMLNHQYPIHAEIIMLEPQAGKHGRIWVGIFKAQ